MSRISFIGLILFLLVLTSSAAFAATTRVWDGGGADDNWATDDNWTTRAPSSPGDGVAFGGSTRLTPSNNYAPDSGFEDITFYNTAGAFILTGNRMELNYDITNNGTDNQTINFDMIIDDASAHYFDTANGNLTFGGIISGDGVLTKISGHTLILSGANIYSGGTDITAGTLQANNASAVGTGALANSATLDLGTTNLTVDGVYTQASGSSLNLSANSTLTFGRLTSTGNTASVDSNSTVNVAVGGYIPNNSTFKIIDTGGSGIGSAPNTITSSSSHVAFTAADSGGDLILTASRVAGCFESDATNSNAAAVGEVFDNMTDPSADMTTVLGALDVVPVSQVASSENTMSPTADRGLINASNGSLDKFVGQTVLRLQDSKLEEIEEAERDNPASEDRPLSNDIWGQYYGDYAHQDPRGLSNGYLAKLWGMAIGIDRGFLDNSLRLGLAQGFSWGRIRSKDCTGRTKINSYQTGIYGEYESKSRPYVLDTVLTYGYNNYDSLRNVVAGSIDRNASSDYHGEQFSSYLEGGYKLKRNDFNITPLLAISYTYLHVAGYEETGADSLNLKVDAQNYDTLQLGTGIRLSRAFETKNMLFTPEFRFRYFYAVINDKQQTMANFAGGGTSFRTIGFRPAPSSFDLGARFEFFNKNNMTFLIDLDSSLKEDYYEGGGSITAKYSF